MVPFVNFCSYAGYIAIILGSILGALNIIWLGIIAEIVILFFQLVTLPVEFDASRRGLKESQEIGFYSNKEYNGGKTVLRAAALTYVASLATVIIEVLRLVLMYGRRND
jgi:Zn-dependent membrane protease YugP